MNDSPPYEPDYLQGIAYFNACEFFEAHEVWEDVWSEHQGESRRFYQGLIQVAVCLHHFGNGNVRGARKLYRTSSNYLEAYRPHHLGLDVDKLLEQFEICCHSILSDDEAIPEAVIDPSLIPEIHLSAP